jgi:serine protease
MSCAESLIGGAIKDAIAVGVIVVAAAGNGWSVDAQGRFCALDDPDCKRRPVDFSRFVPANCPGVISVSANDQKGYLAPYSNYGAVSVMAPGGDTDQHSEFTVNERKLKLSLGVWSMIEGSYGAKQGTSQAAPHVSGSLALLLAHKPWLRRNPSLVAEKLRVSLRRPLRDGCSPWAPCGAGQLDAGALLRVQ